MGRILAIVHVNRRLPCCTEVVLDGLQGIYCSDVNSIPLICNYVGQIAEAALNQRSSKKAESGTEKFFHGKKVVTLENNAPPLIREHRDPCSL